MRYLLFLGIAITFSSCASNKTILHIPANQSVEIDYPDYDVFRASLDNQSRRELDIAVLSKSSGRQVRGFGLGKKSSADFVVESENRLVVKNKNSKPTSVVIRMQEMNRTALIPNKPDRYISFTLVNTSAEVISLYIPSVMNPNLSPNSNSGVDLKIGQEIFFKANRKKYVLLVVDNSINEGDVIDIPVLLKERKKELGIN